MQTDAERQYYLSMVGVRLWYARSPQPGAAPSLSFDFGVSEPVKEEPEARPFPVQLGNLRARSTGGPQRAERLAGLRGLLEKESDEGAGSEPAAQDEQAANHTGAHTDAEQPVHAAMVAPEPTVQLQTESLPTDERATRPLIIRAYWGVWLSERWRLVSGLSPDASLQLQDNLARAILHAMGSRSVSTFTLRWPVFNNPGVAGNDEKGFRELLQELQEDTSQEEVGGRKTLALGLCQDAELPDRGSWLRNALGHLAVDFQYSLAGIATDPSRKRDLWAELRGFRDKAD